MFVGYKYLKFISPDQAGLCRHNGAHGEAEAHESAGRGPVLRAVAGAPGLRARVRGLALRKPGASELCKTVRMGFSCFQRSGKKPHEVKTSPAEVCNSDDRVSVTPVPLRAIFWYNRSEKLFKNSLSDACLHIRSP